MHAVIGGFRVGWGCGIAHLPPPRKFYIVQKCHFWPCSTAPPPTPFQMVDIGRHRRYNPRPIPFNGPGLGASSFFSCLSVCGSVAFFNLGHSFWSVRDTDFIFGMHNQPNDILSNDSKVNDLVTLTVTFILKIANFWLCCRRGHLCFTPFYQIFSQSACGSYK